MPPVQARNRHVLDEGLRLVGRNIFNRARCAFLAVVAVAALVPVLPVAALGTLLTHRAVTPFGALTTLLTVTPVLTVPVLAFATVLTPGTVLPLHALRTFGTLRLVLTVGTLVDLGAVGTLILAILLVIAVVEPQAAACRHVRLSRRNDAVIVLGMLEIVFRHDPVTGCLCVAGQLLVLLGDVQSRTPDLHVRAVRFKRPGQRIRSLTAPVVPHTLLVLISWSHPAVNS